MKTKTQRYGGCIRTATGVTFYPIDPRPQDVRLRDIAIALGKLCRWGGHVPGHNIFSVAQHSVLVAFSLPHHLRVQGLLHDAHEAYLCDVPTPVKRALINYDILAARLDGCIGDRFGVELCDLPPEIAEADARSLATEWRDVIQADARPGDAKPWMARISPWSVSDATEAFFNLALQLGLS